MQINSSRKLFYLTILVFQNASIVLLMSWTRGRTSLNYVAQEDLYAGSVVVVLVEVLKWLLSCTMIAIDFNKTQPGASAHAIAAHLLAEVVTKRPREFLKLSVPALLYAIQNNVLLIALTLIDAATYQVLYQLKVLTTALFAVAMLGQRLSRLQWAALLLLFIGVAIVQVDQTATAGPVSGTGVEPGARATPPAKTLSAGVGLGANMLGLLLVVFASATSGFAGVYFEKQLKDSTAGLWQRNAQLATFGCVFAVGFALVNEAGPVWARGPLHGFVASTWLLVVDSALGGLLVSIVIKHTDNVVKGFATSLAIIVSCLLAWLVFGARVSSRFVAGASLVILAVWLFSPAAVTATCAMVSRLAWSGGPALRASSSGPRPRPGEREREQSLGLLSSPVSSSPHVHVEDDVDARAAAVLALTSDLAESESDMETEVTTQRYFGAAL